MADLNGVTESRFPKLEEGRIPLLDDSHVAMSVNLDLGFFLGAEVLFRHFAREA